MWTVKDGTSTTKEEDLWKGTRGNCRFRIQLDSGDITELCGRSEGQQTYRYHNDVRDESGHVKF